MTKSKLEQLAKYITIGGSLFWIVAGLWGVNNCLKTAKEMKAQYVQNLGIREGLSRNYQIQLATWVMPEANNNTKVFRDSEISGMAGSPYYFHGQIIRTLLVSVLSILVSFLVLYAAVVIDPRWKNPFQELKTDPSFDLSKSE